MAAWLFKTEPSEYAWADLVRAGSGTWDGVSNALALIHLRNVKAGDKVVVYHTGGEKAAVGLARVTRGPYPDPKAGDAKLVVVDVAPLAPLAVPLPLAAFREDPVLAATDLVRLPRLSVVPLTAEQLARVRALGSGRAVPSGPAPRAARPRPRR